MDSSRREAAMELGLTQQREWARQSNGGGIPVSWAASYVLDKATVVVNGTGRLCFEDMKGIAKGANDLLQENKASRVLLDCSDAFLDVKLVDVFYLPECYNEIGVPRTARIALILPKGGQPSGIFEFYETVCRNKGYICKLFKTQQSAEQWLGFGEPNTAQQSHSRGEPGRLMSRGNKEEVRQGGKGRWRESGAKR
jgi:hypothetical protein